MIDGSVVREKEQLESTRRGRKEGSRIHDVLPSVY